MQDRQGQNWGCDTGPRCRAPLPRPRHGQVWKLFERQGGLLSIATQEPNWSRSPSLLGPSWSPVGPTAVEVCAGPGSADAERKANRKENTKSRSKYYKHIVLTIPNEKSKRLHEA